MARFYGEVWGKSQTKASRCGTQYSGLVTNAAGWKGAIEVWVHRDPKDPEVDRFRVVLKPWKGSEGKRRLLAEGVLDASREA